MISLLPFLKKRKPKLCHTLVYLLMRTTDIAHQKQHLADLKMAQYGYITKIQQLHNGNLKIYFQSLTMCPIPQDLLNTMVSELDLQGNEKVNELDRTY